MADVWAIYTLEGTRLNDNLGKGYEHSEAIDKAKNATERSAKLGSSVQYEAIVGESAFVDKSHRFTPSKH